MKGALARQKPPDTAGCRIRRAPAASLCSIRSMDFAAFLQRIDKGAAHLILTDPPYAISRKTGFSSLGENSVERFAVSMDFGKWDHREIDTAKLMKLSYSALCKGGTAIVFYDLWKITDLANAMTAAGFKQLRLVEWMKTNPVPLNSKRNYLTNSREIAVLGVKGGKPTFHSEYDNGQYHHPIPNNGTRHHPTQKPLELMEKLIAKHSNPGDLVIDPFLGSGTTAVAALRLGRRFSGCDIDRGYVDIARERLRDGGALPKQANPARMRAAGRHAAQAATRRIHNDGIRDRAQENHIHSHQ